MHTNPEVLALLALGEQPGTAGERNHVASCPDCSKEVADMARAADIARSLTATDTLTAPSPEVWERIRAELGLSSGHLVTPIATVSSLPVRQHRSDAPARQDGPGRRLTALSVAAGLALVVGIGVGIGYEQRVVKPENRVIAVAQLKPSPQWTGTTATAEVYADGRGNRELVLQMKTPKPVAGTLHVWLMTGSISDPQPMGVLHNGTARLPIPRGMSLFHYRVLDISDEAPNDPNGAGHSGVSVMRGEFV